MEQGIGLTEWRKRLDIAVHQAVERDMGIDPDGCAGSNLKWSDRHGFDEP